MVEWLVYKEDKLPIRFSYSVLKGFKAETGLDIEHLDDDIRYLEIVLWHALDAGYRMQEKKNPWEKSDMEDILDVSLQDFYRCMISSFPKGTEEVKKKQ